MVHPTFVLFINIRIINILCIKAKYRLDVIVNFQEVIIKQFMNKTRNADLAV